MKEGLCSVGLFLSAKGLKVDLSGFKLSSSAQRRERIRVAVNLLQSPLSSARKWSCHEGASIKDLQAQLTGAFSIGGGALFGVLAVLKPAAFFLPMPSALILSTLAIAHGAWSIKEGDREFRSLVTEIQNSLTHELQ